MHTLDEIRIRAPIDRAFEVASNVTRWPEFLPHYRWVTMQEPSNGTAIVEMAAWRPFGAFNYPTWWTSEMVIDETRHRIMYRHIKGITTGMDVTWELTDLGDDTYIAIVHTWSGPRWPLVGGIAANVVIGPVFIHGIASRTLEGVKREAERR